MVDVVLMLLVGVFVSIISLLVFVFFNAIADLKLFKWY